MKNMRSLTLICLIVLFGQIAAAGSIYAKRNPATAKPLYADDKATQIGDVLTIVISEDSEIDYKIDRDLSKDTSHSVGFDGDSFQLGNVITKAPDIALRGTSSKTTEGKSDYKDERTYEDRITVVVEDVLPNGNLVVMGIRDRDVAGDKQTIQVSGIVRPRDVTFDNTVRSDQVANFRLLTVNEGYTKDYTEPGWLAKIFDALWPF